ncbi:chitinase-3-like protein 2 [Belonocnema kinseyi]|uniref:chitinase-3-like protein 2 n=1 Tax=Belonocnema kinseyi TaxID=2817044 RepID=UPI00143D5DCA|nr:chitinase-3-like protein 2 [Belonocnema kinseyi]
MINQTTGPQTKYELLADIQKPRWRKQVVCLVLTFLTVGALFITRAWVGISTARYTRDRVFFVGEKIENAQITAWLQRARMYAQSTKENQNSVKNTASESSYDSSQKSTGKIIVCYFSIPQDMNTSQGLIPSHVDPHICTHIIVGFARVLNCSLNLGEYSWVYRQIANLKSHEPNLKVMVSAGGINELKSGFPEMTKTHANRKIFIRSVLNITKTFNLDGLDLDWEFPAWLGSNDNEKIHFIQLLQELRKEFNRSDQKLLLTAAVAAPEAIVDQSYNVPAIAEHVDFVNLMSYDYHSYVWYYPVTGLNSPLFSRSIENGYLSTLNVNYSANYWISKGMPKEKIVIGIPTYGHSYQLENPLNHDVQAPAKGVGRLGDDSFVPYTTICQFLQSGAESTFLNDSRVPYAYKNEEWISYDDVTSVIEKAKWIKSSDFKGAMILSLNCDDWNATCSKNETFPLIRAVKLVLN